MLAGLPARESKPMTKLRGPVRSGTMQLGRVNIKYVGRGRLSSATIGEATVLTNSVVQ